MGAAYRLSQLVAILVIVVRSLAFGEQSSLARWIALCLALAATILLCSIVRLLSGSLAGAAALVLIALYPRMFYSSLFESSIFFCLVCLLWLTFGWKHPKRDLARSLLLAIVLAFGATVNISILCLSPVVAFGFALLRYVPIDSTEPYFDLKRSLHVEGIAAALNLSIVAIGPWLLVTSLSLHSVLVVLPSWRLSNLVTIGLVDPFVAVAALTTLWWLFVSIRAGSGVPFLLTAIPIAYLTVESLTTFHWMSPAYPILLANLITLLGLWRRGRSNKRVLNSTRN